MRPGPPYLKLVRKRRPGRPRKPRAPWLHPPIGMLPDGVAEWYRRIEELAPTRAIQLFELADYCREYAAWAGLESQLQHLGPAPRRLRLARQYARRAVDLAEDLGLRSGAKLRARAAEAPLWPDPNEGDAA